MNEYNKEEFINKLINMSLPSMFIEINSQSMAIDGIKNIKRYSESIGVSEYNILSYRNFIRMVSNCLGSGIKPSGISDDELILLRKLIKSLVDNKALTPNALDALL